MAIEFTKSGAVNYVRVNGDGTKWRVAIPVGNWEEAEKYLNATELDEVRFLWTADFIEQAQQNTPEEE